MNYVVLDVAPEHAALYLKIPTTVIREQFIESLTKLLNHETYRICTDPVPMDWATNAYKASEAKNRYRVFVVRAEVNFERMGTAYGYFYFKLLDAED